MELNSAYSFLRGKKVVVATYSAVPELYDKCTSFIDLPFDRLCLKNWNAKGCVFDLISMQVDWVIHIDEDAFVTSSENILELMKYMIDNDYVCCGMPDGGVIRHRMHNPVACNPFFIIFHNEAIRAKSLVDSKAMEVHWNEQCLRYVPKKIIQSDIRYIFDEFEPYYGVFFWLCKEDFRILYLNARDYIHDPERIASELCDHLGRPFLVHTWYSRQYLRKKVHFSIVLKAIMAWLNGVLFRGRKGCHYNRINNIISFIKNSNMVAKNKEDALAGKYEAPR